MNFKLALISGFLQYFFVNALAIESLYDYFGISKTATDTEVKKAYHKKALKLHPDKNNRDPLATQAFQLLGEAYEMLLDPERRKWYDSQLEEAQSTAGSTGIAGSASHKRLQPIVLSLSVKASSTVPKGVLHIQLLQDVTSIEDLLWDLGNATFAGAATSTIMESQKFKDFNEVEISYKPRASEKLHVLRFTMGDLVKSEYVYESGNKKTGLTLDGAAKETFFVQENPNSNSEDCRFVKKNTCKVLVSSTLDLGF